MKYISYKNIINHHFANLDRVTDFTIGKESIIFYFGAGGEEDKIVTFEKKDNPDDFKLIKEYLNYNFKVIFKKNLYQ